ncbi:hypothetical protein [Pseudolabrys taiwanensis]|uniref:hypothetical protein n=1 Tax=Pseudolabrys taiwanensis TaxID=331696 RepID=UPI0013B3686D|nr:hypothetical protein [Pseudolabrys taiwanensis]
MFKSHSQIAIASLAALLGLALLPATPAAALTMKECSAKYAAAKKDGTLNGLKWNDFRKKECADNAAAAAPAAPAAAAPAAPAAAAKPAAAPAVQPAATNAVFPKAVDPKYAKEKAGVAREKTCVDQYNANKANNANGGMKWIQKGGGYWSACNKVLKGA